MRVCKKCLKEKGFYDFNKSTLGKDGLTGSCKKCNNYIRREQHKIPSVNAIKKRYYEANKKKIMARDKKNEEADPERFKEMRKKSWAKRMADPIKYLKTSLRHRTRITLLKNGYKRKACYYSFLGISLDLLKIHIERQFKRGMNWDNHGRGEGKWQIDHIIPLASAKTEEEVYHLCHYKNLQPLWWKENIQKNAKILPVQVAMPL